MAHILIYTSARKLLDAGRSGFGTVARSRKLPALAANAIERFSQFDSLRGSDRKRVIFAYRRLAAGSSKFHVLTSIRDAGADYTGRTNHIAQHLLVTPEEARRLAGRGITPADVLLGYPWLGSWDQPPRHFEDSEDKQLLEQLVSLKIQRAPGTREQWARLTGNPLHARFLAAEKAPKSGILVLPDAAAPLPLMAEALAELDARSWDITFTTALEPSDNVGDFKWMFTPVSALAAVKNRCASRPEFRADQPARLPVPEEKAVPQPSIPKNAGAGPARRGTRKIMGGAEAVKLKEGRPSRRPRLVTEHSAPGTRSEPRRRPRKKIPWLPVAGAAAAVLLAAGVLLWVFLKPNGKDGGKSAGQTGEKRSEEQGQLVPVLENLNMPDSGEIAKSVGNKDVEKWKDYFTALREWADNPSWSKLENSGKISVDLETENKGMPTWVEDITALAKLAGESKEKPFDKSQWKKFDEIAKNLERDSSNLFGTKNPFPEFADEMLKRQREQDDIDRDELDTIIRLNLWAGSAYTSLFEDFLIEVLEKTRSDKELQDLCGFLEGVPEIVTVSRIELKDRVALYKNCLAFLKRDDLEKLMKYRKELDGFGGKPEFLMTKLNGKLGIKSSVDTGGGGGALVGLPSYDEISRTQENIPDTSYDGPECVRWVVTIEDLNAGKVKCKLLKQVIEQHKEKDGGAEIVNWQEGQPAGVSVEFDGKPVKMFAKEDKAVRFLKGGLMDVNESAFAVNLEDGTIGMRQKGVAPDFARMDVRAGGKSELVVVSLPNAEETQNPVWGKWKFEVKEQGKQRRDFVIEGELTKRLKEVRSEKGLMFRGKNRNPIPFDKQGEQWVWKNALPKKRKALELKMPDYMQKLASINSHLKGGEVTVPDEIGNLTTKNPGTAKKNKLIKIPIKDDGKRKTAIAQLLTKIEEEPNLVWVQRIQRIPDPVKRKIETDESPKDILDEYTNFFDDMPNEKQDSILICESLWDFIDGSAGKEWFDDFKNRSKRQYPHFNKFEDLKKGSNQPTLKAFAEFLVEQSKITQAKLNQEFETQKERKRQMLSEIEVWAGDPENGGVFLFRGECE